MVILETRQYYGFFIIILLLYSVIAMGQSNQPPTEDEITKTLYKFYTNQFAHTATTNWPAAGGYPNNIVLEFVEPIRIGRQTTKVLSQYAPPVACWPVKTNVRIWAVWPSGDRKIVLKVPDPQLGLGDSVFFFYKNEFDEWSFRTGSL